MAAIRLLFSVVAYLLFFIAFLYLVGFVGNLFALFPQTADLPSIDYGRNVAFGTALIGNIALIALFGLQHSVMARRGFKDWLTGWWPEGLERSFYVLMTVAALVLLFEFWAPMPGLIWSAQADWLRTLLWVLCFAGWAMVFVSTWLLNHFELFGLQQAWADFRGKPLPESRFREPLFYKAVRHPIYTGFLLAFWAAPDMSQGHMLFAIGMTIYIMIGISYEERDLVRILGSQYTEYRTRVGMVIPGIGKKGA